MLTVLPLYAATRAGGVEVLVRMLRSRQLAATAHNVPLAVAQSRHFPPDRLTDAGFVDALVGRMQSPSTTDIGAFLGWNFEGIWRLPWLAAGSDDGQMFCPEEVEGSSSH